MPLDQSLAIAFDQDVPSHPASDHTEPLSLRVTQAVTDAADISPEELTPLYQSIDPEALDSLFAPTYSETSRSKGLVQFIYADHEIIIHSTGDVDVNPIDASDEQQ